MKTTVYILALSTFIIGSAITSCGPSKELVSSNANADRLQQDNSDLRNQLSACDSKVKNLYEEKAALTNENELVLKDLKTLTAVSKLTIAEQALRLKNLNNLINAQDETMSKLMKSIVDALINYKTDELNVYFKDGKVYVALEERLLFKSGSDVVDPKGKEALKHLSEVINSTKDISVEIEGHTDDKSINTKQYKDNWDLSTARATSIVRILTSDYGFDSKRISATGKGMFNPIKTNDTEEGRAANRRIEVILSPDLSELFKLMYQ